MTVWNRMGNASLLTLALLGLVLRAPAAASGEDRVDFAKQIKPLLELHCLGCHRADKSEGNLRLETRTLASQGGDLGPAIVPGKSAESLLVERISLPKGDDSAMPPGKPLHEDQVALLTRWIDEGAAWPDGPPLRPLIDPKSPDNLELIERIHALIMRTEEEGKATPSGDGGPASYDGLVPLTQAKYSMVAIAGGEFLMGSPAGEAGRKDDEGPQAKVRVEPFWIGKYEVTWDEYEPFMITQVDRAKNGARLDYDPQAHTMVDAVSQPTPPYTEMSFGMGQLGFPAISMTQHAANKYCQWLSAQTGHFYRLPTEAEWEYACRAGTTTAYSFGDDPGRLGEHAWYYENAGEKYQRVGKKLPNPWGLHDMHGNVLEWTADQYAADYFTRLSSLGQPQGDAVLSPWLRPETLYPRSVRGGGWYDDPEQLRSAARRGSTAEWKHQDPQLPKSIWYHTDARWLGFRIVRPLRVPSVDEMYFYWNSAANKR